MASSVNVERQALGRHQRHVLLDEARLRLGQDAAEVLARQRLQLDADRQAALQLRQQVGGLGHVERARGDEQDVVGLHRPVLGRHRRAFDQRQQVALHALARNVGADAPALAARADLVDLVEEDDAVVLDRLDRLAGDLIAVDQLVALLARSAGRSCRPTVMRRVLVRPPNALPSMSPMLIIADLPGRRECRTSGSRRPVIGHLDLDLLVVELVVAQLPAEGLRASPAERSGPTSASSTRSSAFFSASACDLLALGLAHERRCRPRPGRG